ncbi:MAG: prephenate dehydrogenase [Phycisphaerae bacterium]|nr:prephenate dehydrogenase [Phycisphaerae bacterium]
MAQVCEPIGVVGYGHFGRALASLLAAAGIPYRVYDPHVSPGESTAGRWAASLEALVKPSRTIVFCVPVRALEPALRAARPWLSRQHLVLDVGSVKVLPSGQMARELGADVAWCATHPLFGPASLSRSERPLRAVVCPGAMHPGACAEARALYERLGCEVVEQSPEVHDQLMAMTHALAFFVAKGMIGVGAGEDAAFVPPSFRAMKQTVDTVRVDAGHLFSVIQNDNPFAADARRKLMDELRAIDAELRAAGEQDEGKDLEIH